MNIHETNSLSVTQKFPELPKLANDLVRCRPHMPAHLRPLASLLAEQLKNYESNPKAMRPMTLRTIERIEEALS